MSNVFRFEIEIDDATVLAAGSIDEESLERGGSFRDLALHVWGQGQGDWRAMNAREHFAWLATNEARLREIVRARWEAESLAHDEELDSRSR